LPTLFTKKTVMRKQTKIVATISDINCEVEFIKRLYDEGMNVARLNTAHQSQDDTRRVIENIRKVSNKIPLLLDTKGPEIRTTQVPENLEIQTGDVIYLTGNLIEQTDAPIIGVSYPDIATEIPVGARILIDDGDIELIVTAIDSEKLTCEAQNPGKIKSKKSINIPGVVLNLPALSPKDIDYIDFAIENDIDFIAHSFVRCKEDVIEIQNILDKRNSKIKIIAKIENQQGVDNLYEILDHVYGVMVARGDLGIEIPAEKIPIIQKNIIKACNCARKPVIVATQMLHSMIQKPRPTRAEVTDVANAIYIGADALMLSGETTFGKYPVEAVQTMAKIAVEVEVNKKNVVKLMKSTTNLVSAFLCKAAVEASEQLPIKAIIADSHTGRTVRELAAYRSKNPIYAICYNEHVMRELALTYGVYADYMPKPDSTDEFIRAALNSLITQYQFNEDELILIIAGNFDRDKNASFIDICTVRKRLDA